MRRCSVALVMSLFFSKQDAASTPMPSDGDNWIALAFSSTSLISVVVSSTFLRDISSLLALFHALCAV